MSIEQEAAALFAAQPKPQPLTKDQAAAPYLRLHYTGRNGGCSWHVGPRGGEALSIVEARANGKLKTWKRTPERWELPVKRGLWEYSYATNDDAHYWHTAEDCPALKAAAAWRAKLVQEHTARELAAELVRLGMDQGRASDTVACADVVAAIDGGQADTREQLENTARLLLEADHLRTLKREHHTEAGSYEDTRATVDAEAYADWEAGRR